MHVTTLRIQNFRRLKDVRIDLQSDMTIFVGANNSGKTSALHAIQYFTSGSNDRFSMNDFAVESWSKFNAFGRREENAVLPKMTMDIWFEVTAPDLHRVLDLLPSLSWQGNEVGIRVEFSARDEALLLEIFLEAHNKAKENIQQRTENSSAYHPFPETLHEFLAENHSIRLKREFQLKYFVLDRAKFDEDLNPCSEEGPLQLAFESGRKNILDELLKVDFLHAQRHLSDGEGGGRAEDLSTRLGRFYSNNLDKPDEDHATMRALSDSRQNLDNHLDQVFKHLLDKLATLGYPGLTNPKMKIKSGLNAASVMRSQGSARVHYVLDAIEDEAESPSLPDNYNGLGYKNLIYMVVELLDLQAQWMAQEENRPPLHLIFIEEPEAHLHAQLQQVFIRKVLGILTIQGEDSDCFSNQIALTTHSPHILYEGNFQRVRYFRRRLSGLGQFSEVLNLSAFYKILESSNQIKNRDFLQRYLKLTHCDLFFADAVILVEGNVERLLLPQMINKVAENLESICLCILEVGGAFALLFRELIEFLGVICLVVTDLDSVKNGTEENPEEDEEDGGKSTFRSTCMAHEPDAVTSNQTLRQWIPRLSQITDLLSATSDARTEKRNAHVRVTYQNEVDITWRGGEILKRAGRTLEEAFAFENLDFSQSRDHSALKLRVQSNEGMDAEALTRKIHEKIKSPNFKKTDFAMALLAENPGEWEVPSYIREGLEWLDIQTSPLRQPNLTAEQPGDGGAQ